MHTLIDLFQTFKTLGDKDVFVYRTGIRRFTYSYSWLHEQSLKMVTWLEQQGIEKGDRVAIWTPNSPWWGVAFWGCVARGAIVVPVDFMSGKNRVEKIVALTEAKLVLQSQYKIDRITSPCHPEPAEGLDSSTPLRSAQNDKNVFLVEDLEYLLEKLSITDYQLQSSPEDTAELIYTSGTTGDPKGVILTHKNLVSNFEQINTHVPMVNEKWNFLSVLPLSHTFEQMAGFLTPLYRGGKIIYLRTLKPSAIMEALAEEDIYAFPIVPRLLMALKTSIERELEAKHLGGIFRWLLHRVGNADLRSLQSRKKWFFPIHHKFGRHFQFFISGGAALPRETAEFWMGMGFRVIEGYGITECSPVLTANTFDEQIIGSTGKPLPGVEVRIAASGHPEIAEGLDSSHSLRMTEPTGEILAKGPNVFPGYYQNEEATKKAFTEDGWFKTGDNGFIDKQGNLHIKGRQKEMIVTGAGINVYPDDIEPILSAMPGVKDACVIGKDTPEGEEVHAVLILNDNHSVSGHSGAKRSEAIESNGSYRRSRGLLQDDNELAKSIIDQANAKLDTLQQITTFTIWPEQEFPKTSTMKIQKFKVKQVVESVGNADLRSLPSADKLISIIATVTGKPSNEISETSILVSDLRLTSIARLELVNTLEQEFRLDLEDTSITQTTTVAELRKMIEKREKRKSSDNIRTWVDSFPVKAFRFLVEHLIYIPLLKTFITLKREGVEHLKNINESVIFIANHVSYLDALVFLWALPIRLRYKTAPAAGDFLFFNKKSLIGTIVGRLMYEYASFFSMALIVGEQFAFRTTLQHMGKVIDRKRHILIFPEGERTWDGKLTSFQPGLGIMVKELKVPVVPIKISGLFEIWPRGKFIQRRGNATITFGKQITFTNETPSEILEKAKRAIETL